MSYELSNKTFKSALIFIVFAELLSLCGFLLPSFMTVSFVVIMILFLVLTLYKLEYGLYIALAELFIGSKGYLFFLSIGDFTLSIRIAFWLVIMSVWAGRMISRIISRQTLNSSCSCFSLKHGHVLPYFLFLFFFIFWGAINGFLHDNAFSDIFLDFNGWLYFSLIFPLCDIFVFAPVNKKTKTAQTSFPAKDLMNIFMAAAVWLSTKALFLLFVFSHNMVGLTTEIYRWVRLTGVGELTQMQGGFYRIFFQSQIFVLAGFFIVLSLIAGHARKDGWRNKKIYALAAIACLLLSSILVSLSRSFWAGFLAGLVFFAVYLFWRYNRKTALQTGIFLAGLAAASLLLIFITVKFPYPNPLGGFSTADLLTNRAVQIKGEAAVSSRWNLLPELWKKIQREAVFGQGFGTKVTYESNDPRIRETSTTGAYTTYAFEWGWLDIWLKLGIIGLLTYLLILFNITFITAKILKNQDDDLLAGLAFGLIVITAVNVFSPYLNHPLGIGYLILVATILEARLGHFRCGQLSLDKN